MEKLKADIDSFTEISDELKWGKDTGRQLETLLTSYIKALTSNIKDRLGNSPKVIEAYAIFDPLLCDNDSFKEYGDAEVRIIADHFFQGMKTREESCFASGRKLIISFLERSSKYQLKVMAVPSSCPSC